MAAPAHNIEARKAPSREERILRGFNDLECPIADARDMSGIVVDLLQSVYEHAEKADGFVRITLGKDEFSRLDFAIRDVFSRLIRLDNQWTAVAEGPRAI